MEDNKDCALYKHAVNELNLLGYNETKEGPDKWIYDNVLQLIEALCGQGHSGHSVPYVVDLFNRLSKFEPLTPLTFKDDEWSECGLGNKNEKVYQNIRKSSIFKRDGNIYDIDAFIKYPTHLKFFGKSELKELEDKQYYSGRLYEMENGIATGRAFRKCLIREEHCLDGYTPAKTLIIPCTEVEVDEDDWMMFVEKKDEAYRLLNFTYNIEFIDVPELKGKNILELTPDYSDIKEYKTTENERVNE